MLKVVLIDASAMSRALLNSVLTQAGYEVVGQSHTAGQGYALVQKFQPQLVCIALEQIDEVDDIVAQIREHYPKTLMFMVSGGIDAPTLQKSLARGVNGFIVRPFKADAVLRTIRSAVLAMVKRNT